MTDTDIIANLKDTAARMTALGLGTPEAIADAQRRLHDAQRAANRELARELRADEALTIDDVDETPTDETPDEDVEGQPI